ncbi:glucose-6-phosphate dehydrogenase [Nocardioides bruguierae]|uniref:Glucose-6-phosphate 1-dehydrogenase n=1 Tax=Nocardioides bruguierae TaxID=2945102 RepID=A0A9X2DAU6_9ACTN|nr:glucose-6-phosphate dehydrogenase [Nocardioides bruguierae]MCM0622295.1 glucose-6-phosphate dehydrogenase [Nocardioides bruguierae]
MTSLTADSTSPDSRSDAVVLFGVSGDLAYKKLLPALYNLERAGRLDGPVIGLARSAWDDERLRARAEGAVRDAATQVDEAALARLLGRLRMLAGEYTETATYEALAAMLADTARPLFHLAVPPVVFESVVAGLNAVGLADRGRVVVEKPFGRDAASAAELNTALTRYVDEQNIFRIDHYLGKESVEGLLVFRFANTLFEPLWNRHYVKSVQVTLAESLDTEGRAGFYDGVGAVRDVVQNHLLQIVALLGMEPPIADDADAYRDEEVRLLRQVRPIDPDDTVMGQYEGYGEEDGVAPGSITETFMATTLWIDSFRWAGVPFHVRAGKALAGAATEAVVELRRPPRLLFASKSAERPEANRLHFRLGHDDGVSVTLQAKAPGAKAVSQPVALGVDFDRALGHRQEAYERLLDDAMDGRKHRFARPDTIAEEWRIVDGLLAAGKEPELYRRGTWGPAAAAKVADPWHPVTTKAPRA